MNSHNSLKRNHINAEEQLLLKEIHKNSISIIPSKQTCKYGMFIIIKIYNIFIVCIKVF